MPRKSDPRSAFLRDMRTEAFAQSHLGQYLNHLAGMDKEGAEIVESLKADLIETFTTESGLRVLKLFEKSVLVNAAPNGSPESALREQNAVRNFVLEIRRIVANG